MAVSGNADAAFIFETNVEEVARRVATGYAEIETSLNRSAGRGGSTFLNEQSQKLDQLVRRKAAELDALAGKFARGEGPANRTFGTEQQRIGRELNQALTGAFRDALAAAPSALPVSKIRELFGTIANEAFAGLSAASAPTRERLRSEFSVPQDNLGRSPGFARTAQQTTSQFDRETSPASTVSRDRDRLEQERQQQREAEASRESADAAEDSAKSLNRKRIADQMAGKSAEEFLAEQQRQYKAILLRGAVRNGHDGDGGTARNVYGTDKYAEVNGDIFHRNSGEQEFDPIVLDRIRDSEAKAVEARIARETRDSQRESAVLNKLADTEEQLLRVQQIKVALEQGDLQRIGGRNGRYAIAQSTEQVFDTRSGSEVFGVDQRAQQARFAEQLDRETQIEQNKAANAERTARREQELLGKQLAAEQERLIGLELQAQLARGEARRIAPTSPVMYSSVDDRMYRQTATGASSNMSELEGERHYRTLRSSQEKEEREQARVVEALQKKADNYNRQGLTQNFLGGLTSRGFGGRGGFSGNFDGLAQTAGITAKYAATSTVLFGLVTALQQAGQEYLDFADSQTNLNIAMGEGEHASGRFEASLANLASQAGSNVGEAMDVAAMGVRAFKDQTDGSGDSIEALGNAFEKQAARIAVLANTDLKDAAGNLKSTTLAFGITPDDAGFARITDALTGAKRIGGGDEKEISQGIASAGVAAHQAGLDVNELAILISRVQAETDQTGTAIGQSFSRAFSIIGGSEGRAAIQRLNATLDETQKIDLTQGPREQLLQLGKVFDQLSTSQQGLLVNSLGGTANPRQVTILLKEINSLIGDQAKESVRAGEGADEYQKRMQDLSKVLLRIRGELKNIAVGLANSGAFAAVGGVLIILEKILAITQRITGAFGSIPGPLRDAAGIALGLYATFKGISAVKAAGGIGQFVQLQERRLTPGRAAARVALRAGEEAATTAKVTATNALSTVNDAKLSAAADRVQVATNRVASIQTNYAELTMKAANDVRVANMDLVAAQSQGAAAVEAATAKLAAAEAEQATVLTRAVATERAAATELATAMAAETQVRRDAVAQQAAVAAAAHQADQEIAAAQLRESQIRQVANARLEAGLVGQAEAEALIIAASADLALSVREAERKVSAAAAASGAPAPGVGGLRRTYSTLGSVDVGNAAMGGIRAVGRGFANLPSTMRTLPGTIAGIPAAFGRVTTSLTTGATEMRTAFNAAAAAVEQGATRQAVQAGYSGGSAGRLGNFVGSGGLRAIGSSALGLAGGPIGVALMAGFAGYSAYTKSRDISGALNASNARLGRSVDATSVADLKDAAETLRSGAKAVAESSSGVMGTIVNFARKDPTGAAARQENTQAARFEAAAKALQSLRDANASSSNNDALAQTIDLSSPDAVAQSLQALTDSGRGAETQAKALALAIDKIGASSGKAATRLDPTQQLGLTQDYTNRVLKGIRDTAEIFGGKQGKFGLGLFGDKIGRYHFASDKLKNADFSPLSATLDETTRTFAANKDINDPAVKAELIKAQRKNIDAFLDSINFTDDPELRKQVEDSALQAISEASKFNSGKESPAQKRTKAKVAAAVLPQVAQNVGQRAGVLSSLSGVENGGRREGDAVVAARTQLDYLTSQRDKLGKYMTKEDLEALDAEIDAATKGLQNAQLARVQTLAQYAANRRPQTDVIGRLDVQIRAVRTALQTATGDDVERLQDQLVTLQQQRAVESVNQTNAEAASHVDSRNKLGNAKQATQAALNHLNQIVASGDTSSAEYWTSVRAYNDAQVAQSQTAVEEANATRSARVGINDTVGEATANYKNARALIATTLAGSPERRAQQRAAAAAYFAEVQSKTKRANTVALSRIDPRDTLANDRQTLTDLRRQLRDAQRYTPKDVDTIASLRRQIAEANLKALTDSINIANAKDSANVFVGSAVQAARAGMRAATRNLRDDKKGTQEYYDDLAAFHQAQSELADAIAAAAQNAYKLTIDLTDPVAQAQASLKEAADKLARDTKAGAPKDVLDADKLAQRDAANALEAAQFDSRMNAWDVADRLGRITHAQHMAYLQGEHDRLSAIVNRTYQQQQELDQVDLALKDIKDNINSAMSGQFNLGDIKVPTVYEVRRSLANETGQAGGAGTVDNSTSNTTVYVNGADFAKVVEYLEYALGQSAQVTRTTGGRKP